MWRGGEPGYEGRGALQRRKRDELEGSAAARRRERGGEATGARRRGDSPVSDRGGVRVKGKENWGTFLQNYGCDSYFRTEGVPWIVMHEKRMCMKPTYCKALQFVKKKHNPINQNFSYFTEQMLLSDNHSSTRCCCRRKR